MPFSLAASSLPRFIGSVFLITLFFVPGHVRAQETAVHMAQGDSLLQAGKPQRALDAFDKAVKAEPTAHTYLGRARAYYALNRNDRFLLDVERSIMLDSTLAEAQYLRALYALRAQDMVKALEHSDKAVRHATDDDLKNRSRIIRGLGLADKKQHAQAIEDLEPGLNAGIEDVEAMKVLARLYDAAGRHQDALHVLERLTVLEPYQVGHWSNRAFELIQLERYDEAMQMIENALALDKDEPVALSNRAFIHYQKGRDSEAMADVERSLRFYPANGHALRTRGLLRLRKGDREKACEDLSLAKMLSNIPEVERLVKEHCTESGLRRD
jgi:tetratricopeptide (TPR) repeat protein